MKVLYDYQAFAMQSFGGVSRSFAQLFSHLPEDIEYDIAIKWCSNEHLFESGAAPNVKFRQSPFKGFSRHQWGVKVAKAYNHLCERWPGQRVSIGALKRGDFDVFHPTFFNPYFLQYLQDKPFVLTVHDLNYEVLHEMIHPRKRDDQIAQRTVLCPRAAHIVAVSENTAADVVKYYHVPENRISVIYHGAPQSHAPRSLKPVFDFRYILYVGSRGSYKNFAWMLNALSSWLRNSEIRLVCTGSEFSAAEMAQIQSLGLEDKVVHRFADTEELYSLYNHAEIFIYPSMYEGFGIPILEAFANGCPVILSRASCFPEIAGDAALYFDLGDNEMLVSHVNALVGDNSLRESLIAAGTARLQRFSWEKSAAALAAVYRSLI